MTNDTKSDQSHEHLCKINPKCFYALFLIVICSFHDIQSA